MISGHQMSTHNNSIANLTRGVGERVLFTNKALEPPVRPTEGIFVKRLASYRRQLLKGLGHHSPVTRNEFVGFYRGPRRDMYQRVADGLVTNPIRPKDAHLKTFVKAEKLNLSLKGDPIPRVIQPRNPRFNVEVGKYLRPVEKLIYKEIDKLFGCPTIMSEYNAYTQAAVLKTKWDSFTRPVCVGLDASRFDQHVSAEALRFEHSIYNNMFRSKELRRLLSWQIHNVGFATAKDGSFVYKKTGSRMSGDMNTSLGNKILMCLMGKAYIDQLGCQAQFANNGDDCLLFMDRRDLAKLSGLKAYFKEFGFNIVTEEPVYEFEQVVFCQTQPLYCNGTWRMVRSLKTCLSKDVTNVDLGHRIDEYCGWLSDVASCGLAIAGDVPVLGRFYAMMKRFGTDHKYGGKSDNDYRWYRLLSRNAKCKHTTPDDEGRLSFFIAFGISPDEQIALETYFDDAVWGTSKRQLTTTLNYLFT